MNNHQELTLAYVNGYRAAKGLNQLTEFPENVWIRGESRSMTCPIARALEVQAYAAGHMVDNKLTDTPPDVPSYVLKTEQEFDKTKKTV